MQRIDTHKGRIFALVTMLLLFTGSMFGVRAAGGALRIGMEAPAVLDPALASNDPEILFNRSIYDYLIEYLPNRTLAPNLAKSWTVSDDGLTYTFALEEGVKFHDGSDFSSADVIFTFNRLKELRSPATNLLGDFEMTAPDTKMVVFNLKAPKADFLYGISSRWALILKDGTEKPNELVSGDKPYASFNGTGPFIVTEYKEGEGTKLTKNANYWKNGQPILESVEFKFIADTTTQQNALRDGSVDFIFKISSEDAKTLESETNIAIIRTATNQHPVIRLRTDKGPGQDVRIRQALKYATDREALNASILDGEGEVGNNDPIGPQFGAFYDANITNPSRDLVKACALIKDAGFTDGLELKLFLPNVLKYPDLATILQSQWQETLPDGSPSCIKVDIQPPTDVGVYYSDDAADHWLGVELGITGWSDYPTPQTYLDLAYESKGIYNETRWSDQELDKLIQEASVTADVTARAEIYHKMSKIFALNGPIIIPYFAPIYSATHDNVTGLDVAPFPGLTDLRGVSVS